MKKAGQIILIIIIILLVAGIGYGGYFLFDKLNVANNEINDLKAQISNSTKSENALENNENVVENSSKDNNTSKNNSNSKNSDEANEAIKKALKDKSWIKANVSIGEENDETYYFMKLNDKPEYIVRSKIMDSSSAVVVSYKDGKVKASKEHAGSDYCEVTVDSTNNIIKSENMSAGMLTYYKISNGEIVEQDSYEPNENGEYGADQKKYDKYNFEEIKTELTDSNIDKYVK